MKMIVPINVNETVLVDSNISENEYPQWSNLTAYVIGNRVILLSTHSVYECILGHTDKNPSTAPDAATYWVRVGATNKWKAFDNVIQDQSQRSGGISYELDVASRADGIALFNLDAESVRIRVNDPTVPRRNLAVATEDFYDVAWESSGFGYTLGSLVEAPDGTITSQRITFPEVGGIIQKCPSNSGWFTNSIYLRNADPGNVTVYLIRPQSSSATPIVVGPEWQRYTVSGFSIANIAAIGVRCYNTTGAILDIWHPQCETGYSATEYQPIDGSGLITEFAYDVTRDLQDYSDIDDYWSYFFDPIVKVDAIVFENVPAYSGTTVFIDVQSSATAKVGEIALGQNLYLGNIHAGASVGIQDFSRRERDTFGNWVIIERAYSDRMNLNFSFDASRIASIRRTLAERRAKATVFHGGEGNEQYGLLSYGFYKDIEFPIVTKKLCVASLEIEGLT